MNDDVHIPWSKRLLRYGVFPGRQPYGDVCVHYCPMCGLEWEGLAFPPYGYGCILCGDKFGRWVSLEQGGPDHRILEN